MERLEEPILPLKPIGRILKLYVKGEVSLKAIEYARDLLDCILIDIAKSSNTYLEETNIYRSYQRLHNKKRLDIDTLEFVISKYINHSSNLYKPTLNFNLGVSAQDSRDTDMSKQVRR